VTWRETDKLWAGADSDDDAVIVRMPNGELLATTVDIITPLVNDPYLFGQLAAANSLSDIFAMGGTPIFAMSVLGFQSGQISSKTVAAVLQGAADKAAEVGVVMAGGHTISNSEMLFGLACVGKVEEGAILRKDGLDPGDLLILTKPIGTGLVGAAHKQGLLDEHSYSTWSAWLSRLNNVAAQAALVAGAKSATDITGFGLLGHLWEMVNRSGVTARIWLDAVPLMPKAREYAAMGLAPGGTKRNLKFVEPHTRFDDSVGEVGKLLLCDAQTSGGLLIALKEGMLAPFSNHCSRHGQEYWVIGHVEAGHPELVVT